MRVPSPKVLRRFACATAIVAVPATAWTAREEPAPVRIVVREPGAGSTVRGRFDMVKLSGSADTGARASFFDVMLVIDVSGSTAYPSGIDVDRDGEIGVQGDEPLIPGMSRTKNTDPEDSILAAELEAALRLLEILDAERVRIGVVSFSGYANPVTLLADPREPSAWVDQPLTADFDAVRRALDGIRLRGPEGGTDMQAGVKAAVAELAGLEGAFSKPREGAQRIILFLTDGRPSLPFGKVNVDDPEDVEAAVQAAKLAAEAGTRINVYGLGPDAIDIDYPSAGVRMSQVSGGVYVPVRTPGDVVVALPGVSFTNVEGVEAVNLTTGEFAERTDVELRPDGSFQAFVPVQPGINRIRVRALASDGGRGSAEVDITFLHQDLSDNELGQELERVRTRNRDLQLSTEKRRQDAIREEERRGLTLDVEDDAKRKSEETEAGEQKQKGEPKNP
jgi:hypothetical protein